MSEERINISLLGNEDGGATLTVLHGDAPAVNNPVAHRALTTIEGPFKYFDVVGKHYPDVLKKAVVLVDLSDATISLDINPHDSLAADIIGIMKENPDLAPFHINNASKRFTGDELTSLLRQKGHVLNIPISESRATTGKFANMKAKISKEIENLKDDAGNVIDNFVQKVSSDALSKIPFKAPIHVGCPVREFSVEVGIEAVNRGVVFYLFSPEYAQELYNEKVEKLAEESKKFTDAGVCLVETF